MSMTKALTVVSAALAFTGVLAASARAADVQVGVNIPVPPVLSVQPPLVVVPTAPQVQYAPQAPYDVFYYGGEYYTYQQNGWFKTQRVGKPWVVVQQERVPQPVLVVPAKYYKVPPGHQKIPPGQQKKKHKHHKGDNHNHGDNDD